MLTFKRTFPEYPLTPPHFSTFFHFKHWVTILEWNIKKIINKCVVVLRCVVSCRVVLYCIVLYCIVLYCLVLYCLVLYCIVLYCLVLYCLVLYNIVLFCIALHCIVMICFVLHCIVLYCIVLYCIVLYCVFCFCWEGAHTYVCVYGKYEHIFYCSRCAWNYKSQCSRLRMIIVNVSNKKNGKS